jgi:hemolysin D
MTVLRYLGLIFLIAAVVALAYDGEAIYSVIAAGKPEALVLTPLGDLWALVHRNSLEAARSAIAAHSHEWPGDIDLYFHTLLKLPGAVVLGGSGLLLLLVRFLGQIGSRRQSSEARAGTVEPGRAGKVAQPAPTILPANQPAQPQLKLGRRDREFLPAALELIETPTSPVKVALLWFICIAFGAVLAWSYFGRFDIHAVARGKIEPSGRSKVVQPLEPGKVVAVLVDNGSSVKAGDTVVELDPTETSADRQADSRDLEASEAEIVSRKFAVEAVGKGDFTVPAAIAFAPGTDVSVRAREMSVLAANLQQLSSALESLKAQIEERRAQKSRLDMSIGARKQLLTVLKERVDTRQSLDDKGQGYRVRVIDALQDYGRENTSLATDQGQLLETDAAMKSLERKLEETRSSFIAEQTQKLAEAERKRDLLSQELIKASTKNERTHLTAPITGTVQQLAVTTLGQVVASGQALMTIVPSESPIEIEAMILNEDIGFVESGQSAVIKVEAFPFTRYGTVDGTVVRVSREAVDERDAIGLSDPTATTNPQGAFSLSSAPSARQTLVFPATVSLTRRSMAIDGKDVPLSAGMAVIVEIKTGQRRVIDYLLSPLRELHSQTGHER